MEQAGFNAGNSKECQYSTKIIANILNRFNPSLFVRIEAYQKKEDCKLFIKCKRFNFEYLI